MNNYDDEMFVVIAMVIMTICFLMAVLLTIAATT